MACFAWKRGDTHAVAFGKEIEVTNYVRNVQNGRRSLHVPKDVRLTDSIDGSHYPFQPSGFPVGNWKVTGVVPVTDPNDHYLNPFFIATSAVQTVNVWALDENGGYDHETDQTTLDSGYGIHWPDPDYGTTTLGCIRIVNKDDLLWLVDQIKNSSEEVEVIITE